MPSEENYQCLSPCIYNLLSLTSSYLSTDHLKPNLSQYKHAYSHNIYPGVKLSNVIITLVVTIDFPTGYVAYRTRLPLAKTALTEIREGVATARNREPHIDFHQKATKAR